MELDKRKLPLNLLVRVRWVDSNFKKGWWHSDVSTAELPAVYTTGYVTHSSPHMLELSGTMGVDGARLNPITIPVAAIDSVEGLKGIKSGIYPFLRSEKKHRAKLILAFRKVAGIRGRPQTNIKDQRRLWRQYSARG